MPVKNYQDASNYKNSEVQVKNSNGSIVTFINGGDNIGVYVSLFATMNVLQLFHHFSFFC